MQTQAHARSQPHGGPMQEPATLAFARAVRPLAASARPRWFGAASTRSTEPALSSLVKVSLPAHSFLGSTKNQRRIEAPVSLGKVTACSKPMQTLRESAAPHPRVRAVTRLGRGLWVRLVGFTQSTIRAVCAVQTALPNPSIERDVQGLAPLAAPHVKR
jgi:hypothetical protein